jgi:hypothetical protein
VNRRGFLGLLGAAVAGATFDPELALWVPGRKSYFDIIRPRNTLITGQFVALAWEKYIRQSRDAMGNVFEQHWARNVTPLTGDSRWPLGVVTGSAADGTVTVQTFGKVMANVMYPKKLGVITGIA